MELDLKYDSIYDQLYVRGFCPSTDLREMTSEPPKAASFFAIVIREEKSTHRVEITSATRTEDKWSITHEGETYTLLVEPEGHQRKRLQTQGWLEKFDETDGKYQVIYSRPDIVEAMVAIKNGSDAYRLCSQDFDGRTAYLVGFEKEGHHYKATTVDGWEIIFYYATSIWSQIEMMKDIFGRDDIK